MTFRSTPPTAPLAALTSLHTSIPGPSRSAAGWPRRTDPVILQVLASAAAREIALLTVTSSAGTDSADPEAVRPECGRHAHAFTLRLTATHRQARFTKGWAFETTALPVASKTEPSMIHHAAVVRTKDDPPAPRHPTGPGAPAGHRRRRDQAGDPGRRRARGRPVLEDGAVLDVANVIWCTGFDPDLSWIDLPLSVRDGFPANARGVIGDQPGLYFVGMPFIYSLTSALLGGVGRDAGYIAEHIAAQLQTPRIAQSPS